MNNKGYVNDTDDVGILENGKGPNGVAHQGEKQISNGTTNLENGESTTKTEPEREVNILTFHFLVIYFDDSFRTL